MDEWDPLPWSTSTNLENSGEPSAQNRKRASSSVDLSDIRIRQLPAIIQSSDYNRDNHQHSLKKYSWDYESEKGLSSSEGILQCPGENPEKVHRQESSHSSTAEPVDFASFSTMDPFRRIPTYVSREETSEAQKKRPATAKKLTARELCTARKSGDLPGIISSMAISVPLSINMVCNAPLHLS